NDPRYQNEQRRRNLVQSPQWRIATTSPIRDWSEPLTSAGVAATLTAALATPNSSTVGSSSTLTVDGVTFHASAPTPETATIKFGSSAPANTSSVTIGSVAYVFETSGIA